MKPLLLLVIVALPAVLVLKNCSEAVVGDAGAAGLDVDAGAGETKVRVIAETIIRCARVERPAADRADAEIDSAVVVEVSKNAVPVGTVPGLQLAAVLKSPEPGAFSQVASCAAAGSTAKKGAMHSAVEASARPALLKIRPTPDIGTARRLFDCQAIGGATSPP